MLLQEPKIQRITFETDLKNTVPIQKAFLLLSDGRKASPLIVPGVGGNLLVVWEAPFNPERKVMKYQLLLTGESAVWISQGTLLL